VKTQVNSVELITIIEIAFRKIDEEDEKIGFEGGDYVLGMVLEATEEDITSLIWRMRSIFWMWWVL